MNRVDRLFAILLMLQRKKRVRAQDLARVFEVSERTIYRDMTALCAGGVPIISLPGEGYELSEGYYLPPLVFSQAEARALFLSIHMLRSQSTGSLITDADTALAKISVALPEAMRYDLEQLAETISFVVPRVTLDLDQPHLATVWRAIRECRLVRLRYHSYSRNETTERTIEPQHLSYYNSAWYVSGYCHLRQELRAFRLERIDALTLLPDTFTPRDIVPSTSHALVTRIRFAPAVVRWVQERQHYGFQHAETVDNRGTVMVYQVDDYVELLPWLLSWGASAEVLTPPALRQMIRAEAQKLLDMLT